MAPKGSFGAPSGPGGNLPHREAHIHIVLLPGLRSRLSASRGTLFAAAARPPHAAWYIPDSVSHERQAFAKVKCFLATARKAPDGYAQTAKAGKGPPGPKGSFGPEGLFGPLGPEEALRAGGT